MIGTILSSALYTIAFILYFIRQFQNFQKNTLKILYQEPTYSIEERIFSTALLYLPRSTDELSYS